MSLVGGHISFSKEVLPTIEEAINNEMNSVQFFLGNPKSFTRQRLQKDDNLVAAENQNPHIIKNKKNISYMTSNNERLKII